MKRSEWEGNAMSVEMVELFYIKLQKDEILQQKFKRLISEEQNLFLNKVVSLGKLAGYDFDESDVRQLIEQLDSELKVKGKIDFRKIQDITGKSIVSFVIGISMIGVLKASNDLASHAFSYYLEKTFLQNLINSNVVN